MKEWRCLLGIHNFEIITNFTGECQLRHCLDCQKRPQYRRYGQMLWYNCGEGTTWERLLAREDLQRLPNEQALKKLNTLHELFYYISYWHPELKLQRWTDLLVPSEEVRRVMEAIANDTDPRCC